MAWELLHDPGRHSCGSNAEGTVRDLLSPAHKAWHIFAMPLLSFVVSGLPLSQYVARSSARSKTRQAGSVLGEAEPLLLQDVDANERTSKTLVRRVSYIPSRHGQSK